MALISVRLCQRISHSPLSLDHRADEPLFSLFDLTNISCAGSSRVAARSFNPGRTAINGPSLKKLKSGTL